MEFVSVTDINDRILQIEQSDIDEANAYLQSIADRYSVVAEQGYISHTVRRLGVVYACYVRAVASVGTDASVTFDGSRHEDVFAQKAEWYKKELNELSAAVTASDFTGVDGKSNAVINLWRS